MEVVAFGEIAEKAEEFNNEANAIEDDNIAFLNINEAASDSDGEVEFDEDDISDEDEEHAVLMEDINVDMVNLSINMVFANILVLRKDVKFYGIIHGRRMKLIKNDRLRMKVKCGNENCEWEMRARKMQLSERFRIIKCHDESFHKCKRVYDIKHINSTFIAKGMLSVFANEPKINWRKVQDKVRERFHVEITETQAKRTKKKAKDIINGKTKDQYSRLPFYAEELKRINPDTTVTLMTEVDKEGLQRFVRFYCCLEGVKEGWKRGCRPFIGLDGCFLYGPHKGILLCAVGVDANNGIYPLAYALVETESCETWTWFANILFKDIEAGDGEYLTVMSDEMKGILDAVKLVVPKAEHRLCCRHLFHNFKKHNKVDGLEQKFWPIARASTEADFIEGMDNLKRHNEKAYKWLSAKDKKLWCRAFYRCTSYRDTQLNNGCESFNSVLVNARAEPVLTMLESIRTYIRDRFISKRNEVQKWGNEIGDTIMPIYTTNIKNSSTCNAIHCGGYVYEVHFDFNKKVKVDLLNRSCTCRDWDMSGIPCMHAMRCILYGKEDPMTYVQTYYKQRSFELSYSTVINPVPSWQFWPGSTTISKSNKIHPPTPRNSRGRPKNSRAKFAIERQVKKKKKYVTVVKGSGKELDKVRKTGMVMTCRYCRETGHNWLGCKKRKKDEVEVQTEHVATPPRAKRYKMNSDRSAPNLKIVSSYNEQHT